MAHDKLRAPVHRHNSPYDLMDVHTLITVNKQTEETRV
jgi:hypothetical protein